jgi:hypothetical protein
VILVDQQFEITDNSGMSKFNCTLLAAGLFFSFHSFAADFGPAASLLIGKRAHAQEKSSPKAKALQLKGPPSISRAFTETSLWCAPKTKTSSATCYCFEPLISDPKKKISFKNELFEINGLIKKMVRNVSLNCNYAEHGTCGDLEYIYCDNRERGSTLRFFSSDLLVAHYTRADHSQYCDGQARDTIVGKIPDCTDMKRKQILYGQGQTPRPPASLFLRQK